MDFLTFAYKNHTQVFPRCLLALDPGETTGWAIFNQGVLKHSGQLITKTVEDSVEALRELFDEYPLTKIIYEDYKVYSWKSQSHSWDALHTPRLIGCIQTLGVLLKIPMSKQMAQQPKQFCDDKKLKMWD